MRAVRNPSRSGRLFPALPAPSRTVLIRGFEGILSIVLQWKHARGRTGHMINTHTYLLWFTWTKVGINVTGTNRNKNAIRTVICLLAHLAMTFWNFPLFRRQRQIKPLVKYTHWFTRTKNPTSQGLLHTYVTKTDLFHTAVKPRSLP